MDDRLSFTCEFIIYLPLFTIHYIITVIKIVKKFMVLYIYIYIYIFFFFFLIEDLFSMREIDHAGEPS